MYSEVFLNISKRLQFSKVCPWQSLRTADISGEQYVSVISKYADAIIENTEISTDDR